MLTFFINLALGFPKRIVKGTIRFYQASVSPDHGPLRFLFPYGVCKFKPTCSEYALEAVDKYGITRGLLMAYGRLWRCTPWSVGGHDPVPERK